MRQGVIKSTLMYPDKSVKCKWKVKLTILKINNTSALSLSNFHDIIYHLEHLCKDIYIKKLITPYTHALLHTRKQYKYTPTNTHFYLPRISVSTPISNSSSRKTTAHPRISRRKDPYISLHIVIQLLNLHTYIVAV